MPSLKDLKNRIASVTSTKKITRAMQMVAAAKLRRSQEAAEASRPYSDRIARVLANLASTVKDDPDAPPLLIGTGKDDVHLVVVATADRGLCGAFNTNIVRAARAHINKLIGAGKTVKILCVGKKGRDQLKRLHGDYIIDLIDFTGVRQIGFTQAQPIAKRILEMFADGAYDVCTIFYSEFVTVMSQKPTARQLIPAVIAGEESPEGPDLQGANYEYEPDEESIVAALLPLNLGAQVFRALLENAAGEQGARMAAMDSATRNAGELIDKLTLQFNRTRQANITRELIEIVSGAEAL
jgi:F-type H+-transporting ATPase subunit gamma